MTTVKTLRIVSVDDDTFIREAAGHLLEDVEVVGQYPRVEHLLQAKPSADVVLLDLHLRGPDEDPRATRHGLAGVRAAVEAGYQTLIYTNERRREVLAVCLVAGAAGVVNKTAPTATLRKALDAVASGGSVVPTSLVGLVEAFSADGSLGQLPPRQTEVLRARARGEQFKSIARRLEIDERTVEHHMYEVTRRFRDYLRSHSVADLEHRLGLGKGDLLDLS